MAGPDAESDAFRYNLRVADMPTSAPKVRLESQELGVRVITLADAAHRNAIDRAMCAQLKNAVAEVAQDADARALVVMSDGPTFCAGADLIDTFDGAASRPIEELRTDLIRIYDSFLGVRELAIPTIAAVQGAAVGAGANLAFACDIRLASRDASFAFLFTQIGLHPGGGASYFLATTLGPQRALRILLDGETIGAEAAARDGLVERIVDDPVPAALELACRWSALDPDLVRSVKRAIRLAQTEGLAASVEHESRAQARSAQRPEIQAAVDRLRARRREKG